MNLSSYPTRLGRIGILLIIAIPIILFISLLYPDPRQPNSILWTWWCSLLGSAILIFLFGWGVTGRPSGAWINNQNQYSLTQVQLVTWTTIFVASLITAMLWNRIKGSTEPVKITIPGELWALLGISVGTTAGSALILTGKKNASPNATEFLNNVYRAKTQGLNVSVSERTLEELSKTNRNLRTPEESDDYAESYHAAGIVDTANATMVSPAGQAVQYEKPLIEAFFAGDEVGALHFLDIGKVQMFFFTLVVVLAYSASVVSKFLADASKTVDGGGLISGFPPIDQSLIVLIAISHAGYLTYQGVSKSASADAQVHPIIPNRAGVQARGLGKAEAQQISDQINDMAFYMRGVHSILRELESRLDALEERRGRILVDIESRVGALEKSIRPGHDADETGS